MAPEPTLVTSDNAVTLDVVYTPLVTVAALPVISLIIAAEKVFAPTMVWSPDVITAPAANTLSASVTSAAVSIPDNLVRSASVIIAPEPTSVTSDNAVTLDVVYTPLVTVEAFPEISPIILFANVTAPVELILIAPAVVVEPIVLPSVILILSSVDTPCTSNVLLRTVAFVTDNVSLIETADKSDVPATYSPLLRDASFVTYNLLFIVTSFATLTLLLNVASFVTVKVSFRDVAPTIVEPP